MKRRIPNGDILRTFADSAYFVRSGVGCHWWFNYLGPLLDVELEFACLSG